jgi:hypothetical protein
MLNNQFTSVYTTENTTNMPSVIQWYSSKIFDDTGL